MPWSALGALNASFSRLELRLSGGCKGVAVSPRIADEIPAILGEISHQEPQVVAIQVVKLFEAD